MPLQVLGNDKPNINVSSFVGSVINEWKTIPYIDLKSVWFLTYMKNTERKVPRFKKKSKLMLIKTKELSNNESVSVC